MNTTNSSTGCASKTAVILVTDGGMTRSCGCTEAQNQTFGPGTRFVCTVPAGTNIQFFYLQITQIHQIYISNLWTFSPKSPDSQNLNQADAYQLNVAGSYTFGDTLTQTGGTITVQ